MRLMRFCLPFVHDSNLMNQGAMTLRRGLFSAITIATKCAVLLLVLWSQASASISHTKIFVQQGGNSSSLTFTFSASANAANEAVVVGVDCVSNTAATAVSLTGSGWTFTQLGGIGFSGSSSAAVFGAISPNTTSATFTVTWTGAGSCTFHREMGDEFGGVNTTGGTTTFDCGTTCSGGSNNAHSTNGSCSVNVTTGSANEAVWGVCWPSSSVTALGTGYSAGANDAQGDRAEYKLTTDAAGTVETVNFTSTTTYNAVAVTIKPADAGSTSPSITSLSPTAGPVGTPVTISGSNFGSTQGTSTVSFGGVNTTPTSWTSTAIGVTVPAGLSLGSASVSVTVPGSGTSNSATFTVVAPLAIAASAAPTANAAGWNNSNVTVSYQCTGGVAPAQCPSSQTVTTEGASQVISATATDAIGESVTANVTLKIDKTTPALAITSPANNFVSPNASLQVNGNATDALSGVATVTCNGVAATVSAGTFACSVNLATGSNTVSVNAVDVAGNQASQAITVIFGVPTIASLNPTSGSTGTAVTISGAAFGSATGQVTFNGTPATVSTWADTSISVLVPTAATTGNVVVTTSTNVASNGVAFTVSPLISSLTPSTGPVGQPISISGSGFGATAGSVLFAGTSGSVSAVVSGWSNTSISVSVPSGAITGNVVVVTGSLSSPGVPFSVVSPVTVMSIASPTPNAAGWNSGPVFVDFQCSGGVPPISCPGGQTVSTDGANQLVTGTATDALGNSATASTHVNLDQVAPAVAILAPDPSVPFSAATVAVAGTVSDSLSGVSLVTCNGSPAIVTSGNFTCNAPVSATNPTISVQAIDVAGNASSASQIETPVSPKVHISAPAALLVTNQQTVNVSGTVDDPAATVASNGVQGSVSGSNFTISAVPLKEGKNLLTVAATNVVGGIGTDTVSIFLDTTPPTVHVDSPTDGGILTQPQVTVTGSVNDVVTGTVNSDQVSVTVNGATASVSNRSFSIANVLLVPGTNTITAIARDPAGNVSQHQIQVTLRDLSAQQKIVVISGNNQQGIIGAVLANPLVVQLVDGFGRPLAGRSVTFHVSKSDGTLQAFPNQARDITLQTGPDGQASVQFQLGSRIGVGVNQVSVSSSGFVGEVVFSADSLLGPPAQIHAVSGEGQKGQVNSPLPEPLVVIVTDAGGNPVPGASVLYKIGVGSGSLEGSTSVTKTTDGDGKAVAVLTLGPGVGINSNMVSVGLPGTQVDNTGFVSSGIAAGPPASTSIAGVVLDNADQPIPNVTVSVKNTNFSALTNDGGQFTIANAPVGNIVLYVDGSTSTRPETFPTLSFQMATVPGVENSLSGPIFLPAIDVDNSQVAGGDQDVVLTMKGVPGIAYKVFAHSVTFADGSHIGRLSVTQVHADRVPMAPPNGTAPRLMATLQPPGVSFNPPIQMTFPNTDSLPPGQVVEIYSYRHDLEQFVVDGTGHVSDDGSVITSDPGSGLSQSGWHGPAAPPPATTTASNCGDCRTAVLGLCAPNPAANNDSCNDACVVAGTGKCGLVGSCNGTQKTVNSLTLQATDPEAAGSPSVQQKIIKIARKSATIYPMQFTATASSSGCSATSYDWDFGDGEKITGGNGTQTHNYGKTGKYSVQVTAKCDQCTKPQGKKSVTMIVAVAEIKEVQTSVEVVNNPNPFPGIALYKNPTVSSKIVGKDDTQDDTSLNRPISLPVGLHPLKLNCFSTPDISDPDVGADIKALMKWLIERDANDVLQGAPPSLVANGASASVNPNIRGSFHVSCYLDGDNDGTRGDTEPRKVQNFAFVGIDVVNLDPLGHKENIHQNTFSVPDPKCLAQVPPPDGTKSILEVCTGGFDTTNPAFSAMETNATVHLVGVGQNGQFGPSDLVVGFAQDLNSDFVSGNYGQGTTVSRVYKAIFGPGLKGQTICSGSPTAISFPILDANQTLTGGVSVMPAGVVNQTGTLIDRSFTMVDSPSQVFVTTSPCDAEVNPTPPLLGIGGVQNFRTALIVLNSDFPGSYVVLAHVDWVITIVGNGAFDAQGNYVWTPSQATNVTFSKTTAGYPKDASDAGLQLYGPAAVFNVGKDGRQKCNFPFGCSSN